MSHITTDNIIINENRIAHGVHGAGEPIVLMHGTPSSSYIWRNIMPPLVSAGFKVHVFDLLGYGLSERPWDPMIDTSMTAQVPVLEGLLDHWELERFHLVAHDIGGGVAQRFGIQSTERLYSLTMIDVVSYDSYPSKRTRQQMEAGLATLIEAPDIQHRARFREWLLSTVQDKQKLTESALDVYLDFISGPVGQASFFQHQVRHYNPKHTMELADRMHILGQVPIKLIWGADDMWQVTEWAHKLNTAIPGSKLDILEDCGHFSLEDQPEKISEIIVNFATENTRSS